MKKLGKIILGIVIALAVIIVCFVGCCAIVAGGNSAEQKTDIKISTTNNEKAAMDFKEVAVFDNEDFSMKITGIDPNNIWGYSLKVLIENKNPNKTFTFSVDTVVINGVEVSASMYADVAPNKKANEEITIMSDGEDELNIMDYTDIEVIASAHETDNYSNDAYYDAIVHVYPYGEEKVVAFTYEPQPTDVVLLDDENVYIAVVKTGFDSYDDYEMRLVIYNKTDKAARISVDEASINGFMIDPYFGTTVGAGHYTFKDITWYHSSLEDNNIIDITEVEITVVVRDDNHYSEVWSENTFSIT